MPAYSRLIAASAAACSNEVKERTGSPNATSVVSSNANAGPNCAASTVLAAFEMTLWPLVYSGDGGVWRRGVHVSSRYVLIAVSGRVLLLRYFSSHDAMKPS